MSKMDVSGENLARSEDRNGIMRISPISWAGLEWPNPLSGIPAYFTPASPTNRVFLWARFRKMAKMRQQVPNPCSGLLVSVITRDISTCLCPCDRGIDQNRLSEHQAVVGVRKSGPNGLFPDADSKGVWQ